jgi:outer membrane immunogenic protein
MKRTIFSLILGFCFAAVVHAGPEAISGKEMKQVAPPPAPECPNWSGFYVGGFGGYVRSNVDRELALFQGWLGFPLLDDALAAGSADLDFDGGEAGGLIGFNWQFNHWVVGAEGSGAYLWARELRVDSFPAP